MVREFDEVVFTGEVGKVLGPVKTQFGYHLIEITSRTE
jgi:peptidyl-prolyl cis-trans isomerase C